MTGPNMLRGGCHCGKIKVKLVTSIRSEELNPRACDCSFCLKHGASYVSDPRGRLSIEVRGSDALCEYRQGSGNARFLACRFCGVLVAVVYDDGSRLYGTVNSKCIDGATFGTPQVVSPQKLSGEDKTARWVKLWTPDVELNREI